MDCLVGQQLGLVAHKPQKNKPAEFWLLGSSVGSCRAVTVAASPMPQPAQAPQPSAADLAEMDRMMQEQSDQMLKLAQSKDPNERYTAISNLGSVGAAGDPNVDEVLQNALTDKDSNVRSQAIQSIAQRGGDDADSTIAQALKDKDANVRVAAVTAVQSDLNLLQQALGDSDQTVRETAQARLDDLANRQK
jgi:hypothetical protein